MASLSAIEADIRNTINKALQKTAEELTFQIESAYESAIDRFYAHYQPRQYGRTHLTRLKHLLNEASKGRYGRDMALTIRDAATSSIATAMPAKSLELKHTIRLIEVLSAEIDKIENAINAIMETLDSPITTIPGIKNRMGAMILAEIGDFSRFDNPDQILVYAGLSPTTYQSGQMTSSYAHMEKRGFQILTLCAV